MKKKYINKELKFLALYNHELDIVIEGILKISKFKDPDLMAIPIDDCIINRAYSCFDSLYFR